MFWKQSPQELVMAYGAQGRMEIKGNSTGLGLSNWWMVVPTPDGNHFSAFPALTPWSKPPSSPMFTPAAVSWLVSLLLPLLPPSSRMDCLPHQHWALLTAWKEPPVRLMHSRQADGGSLCGTVLARQHEDTLLAREGLRRSLN